MSKEQMEKLKSIFVASITFLSIFLFVHQYLEGRGLLLDPGIYTSTLTWLRYALFFTTIQALFALIFEIRIYYYLSIVGMFGILFFTILMIHSEEILVGPTTKIGELIKEKLSINPRYIFYFIMLLTIIPSTYCWCYKRKSKKCENFYSSL